MVHGKIGVVGILNKQLDRVEEKANGPKSIQPIFVTTNTYRYLHTLKDPFTFYATAK